MAAARLDFSEVKFLDKELFTDLPEGALREPDLVAETRTVDGEPEILLTHIGVQAQKDRQFAYRLFEYYALLRLRTKKPVYPVALFLVPGTGGITRETYTQSPLGETVVEFRFAAVALPDLTANAYLDSPNPLGPALASLMRPSKRPRQKLDSMLRAARPPADEARKSLLAHVVESYVELNRREAEEYEPFVGEMPAREAQKIEAK